MVALANVWVLLYEQVWGELTPDLSGFLAHAQFQLALLLLAEHDPGRQQYTDSDHQNDDRRERVDVGAQSKTHPRVDQYRQGRCSRTGDETCDYQIIQRQGK